MINLTKEQIKETLERLKDYCYWMYYNKDGIEGLKKQIIDFEGHKFYLEVQDDGLIKMILENDITGIFNVIAITHPLKKEYGIDNVEIKTALMNKQVLTPEYIQYFEKAGIFVCSFWQRAVTFTFLSRIQSESIEGIATALLACNKE